MLRGSSKLFQIIHFRDSSSKLGVHLFKIHHKEAPSIQRAAANWSYQVGAIFQKEIWKYIKRRWCGACSRMPSWGTFVCVFSCIMTAC